MVSIVLDKRAPSAKSFADLSVVCSMNGTKLFSVQHNLARSVSFNEQAVHLLFGDIKTTPSGEGPAEDCRSIASSCSCSAKIPEVLSKYTNLFATEVAK